MSPARPALQSPELAHRLRLFLEDGGGMFVKVGQIASTRGDLLPDTVIAELSELRTSVRTVPAADIREVIEGELGQPVEDLFASFDWEPLAAASIGQTHRAVLRDGAPVVVKVQRPASTTWSIATPPYCAGPPARWSGACPAPAGRGSPGSSTSSSPVWKRSSTARTRRLRPPCWVGTSTPPRGSPCPRCGLSSPPHGCSSCRRCAESASTTPPRWTPRRSPVPSSPAGCSGRSSTRSCARAPPTPIPIRATSCWTRPARSGSSTSGPSATSIRSCSTTLRVIDPGFELATEAKVLFGSVPGDRLDESQPRLQSELIRALPARRTLPDHAENLANLLGAGQLTLQLRRYRDADAPFLDRWVDRVVLAGIGGVGLLSSSLLLGAPGVSDTAIAGVVRVIGFIGLIVASTILRRGTAQILHRELT